MAILKNTKFAIGDILKHFKGGIYTVSKLPDDESLLEESREPFYSYTDAKGITWHRKVSSMESEGRFEKIGAVEWLIVGVLK